MEKFSYFLSFLFLFLKSTLFLVSFCIVQCAESFIFLAYKETLLVEFHVCEIRITCNFRSIVFFLFFFRNKKLKAVMHFAGELFSFVIKNLIYFLYVLQHAIRVTGLCGGGVHILGNSCAESSSWCSQGMGNAAVLPSRAPYCRCKFYLLYWLFLQSGWSDFVVHFQQEDTFLCLREVFSSMTFPGFFTFLKKS